MFTPQFWLTLAVFWFVFDAAGGPEFLLRLFGKDTETEAEEETDDPSLEEIVASINIEVLSPEPGDVIVVHLDGLPSERVQNIRATLDHIWGVYRQKYPEADQVLLLTVQDGLDLELLDAAQMREYGWVRAE